MYSIKERTTYKGYVIQPYYHSHQAADKQWGYRIWKGYELMWVDEVGRKSSQEAVIAAQQEIDKGYICKFCFKGN